MREMARCDVPRLHRELLLYYWDKASFLRIHGELVQIVELVDKLETIQACREMNLDVLACPPLIEHILDLKPVRLSVPNLYHWLTTVITRAIVTKEMRG
jgi:hypothetical protein